jgi:hypothetical protein
VKQAFSESGAKTKYDISRAIPKRFPNSRPVYHVSENMDERGLSDEHF